jgi:hypothetical protein
MNMVTGVMSIMLDKVWEVIGFLALGKQLPLDSNLGHRKPRVMDAMRRCCVAPCSTLTRQTPSLSEHV